MYEATAVLSVRTNTWWSLRSGRKCFSARTTASISSWCATWDGNRSTDRGQGGHSWPLPNRWEMRPSLLLHGDKELPAPGPKTRTKVVSTCLRHVGITVWPWSCEARGEPLGLEPPLWGSHVQQAKRYHVGRRCHHTQQFLKLPDSEWPAFSPSLDCREDRLDLSRGHTCLHRGRIPHNAQISGFLYWRKHTFLALSLNPSLCERERHLNAELLSSVNELISTKRRCGWACGCPGVTEEPEQHPHTSWKCRVRLHGRKEEPDIGTLCPQSKPQELPVMGEDGDVEVCVF